MLKPTFGGGFGARTVSFYKIKEEKGGAGTVFVRGGVWYAQREAPASWAL